MFAIPDPTWGQLVGAAIVPSPTAAGNPETARRNLAAFVRQHLATYKRPRRFCFVDSLPQNRSHKVSRRAVARAFASQLQSLC